MKVTPHTLVLHADSVYSSESVSVTLGYVRTANRKKSLGARTPESP